MVVEKIANVQVHNFQTQNKMNFRTWTGTTVVFFKGFSKFKFLKNLNKNK